jgi:lysophospholipase L1-like esterase
MNRIQMPIVAAQGMWKRATMKLDPPATGPTSGTVPGRAGEPPLHLGVLGESTAAGCGVDRQENAFTGSLSRDLAERTGRPVEWQVVGQFGATTRRIRHKLLPQVGHDLTIAVLLSGGNDVMSGRSPGEWREDLTAIVDGLLERAGHVVVAGIPPFERFPSMPRTLGRFLSERSAALDEVSRQICAERPATQWVTMTEMPLPHFFASDGFHLSSAGYKRWAEVIADNILARVEQGRG